MLLRRRRISPGAALYAGAGVTPVSVDASAAFVITPTAANNDNTLLTVGAGATLLLAVVASRSNIADVTSVTWDVGGSAQTLTLITSASVNTGAGGGAQMLAIYGFAGAVTPGNKTLRVVSAGSGTVYSVGAISWKNTNTTLAVACTVGGTTGSGPGLAPRTDTITVGANHMGLVTNKTNNFNSSNATFSPTGQSNEQESDPGRVGFIPGTGTVSLTIDNDHPNFDDACGICLDISP